MNNLDLEKNTGIWRVPSPIFNRCLHICSIYHVEEKVQPGKIGEKEKDFTLMHWEHPIGLFAQAFVSFE